MLQVAVHGDNDLAPGMVETGLKSSRLSEILAQPDDFDGSIRREQFQQQLVTSIRAPIIDKDQLVGRTQPFEHTAQLLIELLDVIFLVVKGDDDRNLRIFIFFIHWILSRSYVVIIYQLNP